MSANQFPRSEPMQTATAIRQRTLRVAGYHKWRDLLFLHWRAPAEDVQRVLPSGLTVETFDGWAWVGLVAFDMRGVRPWWFPAVPGVSAFHETNVRTYVTRDGDDRGVWFFSLDATNSIAVRVARRRWHLNYYRSDLRITRNVADAAQDGPAATDPSRDAAGVGAEAGSFRHVSDRITYSGRRLWPGVAGAAYEIEADISADEPAMPAAAGTFEEFLVERYVLYARKRDGTLLRGEVRHVPYPLRPASVAACEQSLLPATGIAADGPPDHAVFSPGVDVTIGALERLSFEAAAGGTP
jgi:uncharacterized protein